MQIAANQALGAGPQAAKPPKERCSLSTLAGIPVCVCARCGCSCRAKQRTGALACVHMRARPRPRPGAGPACVGSGRSSAPLLWKWEHGAQRHQGKAMARATGILLQRLVSLVVASRRAALLVSNRAASGSAAAAAAARQCCLGVWISCVQRCSGQAHPPAGRGGSIPGVKFTPGGAQPRRGCSS